MCRLELADNCPAGGLAAFRIRLAAMFGGMDGSTMQEVDTVPHDHSAMVDRHILM